MERAKHEQNRENINSLLARKRGGGRKRDCGGVAFARHKVTGKADKARGKYYRSAPNSRAHKEHGTRAHKRAQRERDAAIEIPRRKQVHGIRRRQNKRELDRELRSERKVAQPRYVSQAAEYQIHKVRRRIQNLGRVARIIPAQARRL